MRAFSYGLFCECGAILKNFFEKIFGLFFTEKKALVREKADGYFANTKGWHSEAADCQHLPKDRSIANEKAFAYNIAVRSDIQIN